MDLILPPNLNQATAPAITGAASKVGKDFEAFFVYQMLELMDTGTPSEFGGGAGEDAFRQIRNEYLADALTERGTGIGIAEHVTKQLIELQAQTITIGGGQ